MDRIVTFQYFQLDTRVLNSSHAFGAGHVKSVRIYIYRAHESSSSPTLQTTRQLQNHSQNMGELKDIENTLAISKSFKKHFSSTTTHTIQIYTFSQRAESYFTAMYFLVFTCTFVYTYVSRNYPFIYSFCPNDEHTYIQICSNNSHLYSHYSCIIYPPPQIRNKHIRIFATFYELFLVCFVI